MAKVDKPLTKDALVSMQVIDAKGRCMGKVKDLAFAVGQSGMLLAVENKTGETQCILWENIQAASDFIVLKPQLQKANQIQSTKKEETKQIFQAQQTPQTTRKKKDAKPRCQTCNKPLTWIPKYQRWYCYKDKQYANQTQSSQKEGWQEVFGE